MGLHLSIAAAAALVGAAAFLPTMSEAAVTSYSDRAAWQTAAGGGVGDIFDNLNSGTADRGTFAFSSPTGAVDVPNTNPTTDIDGTPYARIFLEAGETVALTFVEPIVALGFDVNPWCNGGNCAGTNTFGLQIDVIIDGILSGSYNLPSTYSAAFVGFHSDTAFSSFVITTSATNAWHGMDNVEAFSAPTSVPLPAAFSMFGAGLAALGFVGRRRKRAA